MVAVMIGPLLTGPLIGGACTDLQGLSQDRWRQSGDYFYYYLYPENVIIEEAHNITSVKKKTDP